jgi:hypothetical protein
MPATAQPITDAAMMVAAIRDDCGGRNRKRMLSETKAKTTATTIEVATSPGLYRSSASGRIAAIPE